MKLYALIKRSVLIESYLGSSPNFSLVSPSGCRGMGPTHWGLAGWVPWTSMDIRGKISRPTTSHRP